MHAYAFALALLQALLFAGAPSFANASDAPAEFLRIYLKAAPVR